MRTKFGVEVYMTVLTIHILKRKTCLKYNQNQGNQMWVYRGGTPHAPVRDAPSVCEDDGAPSSQPL